MDPSTLLKRLESTEKRHVPTGAVVAIVLGVIAIVAVSIFCCCPCWKKGCARPKALQPENKAEDVGGELGGANELDGEGNRVGVPVHEIQAEEIPPPQYEKVAGVQMGTRSDNDGLGGNGGVKEGM